MTPADLARLRQLAAAAKPFCPGRWADRGEFIDAASPDTVLALLDRLAEAESSRDWLRALIDNMPGPARPIGGGMYAGPAGP